MDEHGETGALAGVPARMLAWRQEHPRATLREIEDELDRQVQLARAALLAELVTRTDDELGVCPDCGGRLVRRGRQDRTLVTSGDVPVTFTRSYVTCSVCGRGLFPPG
jgi:uncharacterized protein with PIN domain